MGLMMDWGTAAQWGAFLIATAALISSWVNVGIKKLSSSEKKLAPDGVGFRWEFSVELINLGEQATF
jgi:hypothetical protein